MSQGAIVPMMTLKRRGYLATSGIQASPFTASTSILHPTLSDPLPFDGFHRDVPSVNYGVTYPEEVSDNPSLSDVPRLSRTRGYGSCAS